MRTHYLRRPISDLIEHKKHVSEVSSCAKKITFELTKMRMKENEVERPTRLYRENTVQKIKESMVSLKSLHERILGSS